jgi:hypothetical protein
MWIGDGSYPGAGSGRQAVSPMWVAGKPMSCYARSRQGQDSVVDRRPAGVDHRLRVAQLGTPATQPSRRNADVHRSQSVGRSTSSPGLSGQPVQGRSSGHPEPRGCGTIIIDILLAVKVGDASPRPRLGVKQVFALRPVVGRCRPLDGRRASPLVGWARPTMALLLAENTWARRVGDAIRAGGRVLAFRRIRDRSSGPHR